MIEFEETGEVWTKVSSYSINESFFTPSDGWEATVYSEDPVALRRKFLPRSRVSLYLDDRRQLIGHIDWTEGTGGRALKIGGRDYLGSLVDASIDKTIRITSTMSLADALIEGLRVFGITEIEGDLDAVKSAKMGKPKYVDVDISSPENFFFGPTVQEVSSPENNFLGDDRIVTRRMAVSETVADSKPQDNEGAFDWAARLAARSGFSIQPGSKRSAIAVVAPDYSGEPQFFLWRSLDGGGNVESGKARRDYGGIPLVTSISSRFVTAGLEAKGKAKVISIVGDESELSLWRSPEAKRILQASKAVATRRKKTQVGDPTEWYCPVYYKDYEAKNESQLNRSARRFTGDRIRDTLTYECTLPSHDDRFGLTYSTNALARTADEIEDLDEVLWIAERTISGESGESTRLKLIRPASYVL